MISTPKVGQIIITNGFLYQLSFIFKLFFETVEYFV